MTRAVSSLIALSLLATLPSAAFAAPPNRQPPPPRQAAPPPRQPPPPRQAAPPPRQPPPPRAVPQPPRVAPPTQGFNLNHDITVHTPPVTQQRPPVTQQRPPVTQQRPPITQQRPPIVQQRPPIVQQRPPVTQQPPTTLQRTGNTGGRPAPNFKRAPFTTAGHGPYQGRNHGPVVQNPHHWSGNWQWNRGLAWQPAPTYWGGGFWGPFAIGALASAALFGYIADSQDQVYYPSYQVEPDSPGAQLLQNYGLQQTPCGQDNLVVIWGPDNSVICAFPNDTVGPGNYDLDPTTLSLVSDSQ
jgi:hypothetical protein